jgi:hypothetical protein
MSIERSKNWAPMRVIGCTLLLFGFLIYQFYSGSIVSSIIDVKRESIKTLKDLTDSHLQLGLEDIIYDRDYFKVSLVKFYHPIKFNARAQVNFLFIDSI